MFFSCVKQNERKIQERNTKISIEKKSVLKKVGEKSGLTFLSCVKKKILRISFLFQAFSHKNFLVNILFQKFFFHVWERRNKNICEKSWKTFLSFFFPFSWLKIKKLYWVLWESNPELNQDSNPRPQNCWPDFYQPEWLDNWNIQGYKRQIFNSSEKKMRLI